MPETYWLENHLPSEWTPIGDRGTEYRFIQHIPGGWLGCLRQFVGRYGNWSEMTVMTVRPGMSEDYIRTMLFEAVYQFEKAFP